MSRRGGRKVARPFPGEVARCGPPEMPETVAKDRAARRVWERVVPELVRRGLAWAGTEPMLAVLCSAVAARRSALREARTLRGSGRVLVECFARQQERQAASAARAFGLLTKPERPGCDV